MRGLGMWAFAVGCMLAMAGWASAQADEQETSREALVAPGHIPGFDISWPQCGKAYPPGPIHFAIIGINDGRPFTAQECFMHQYRWAQRIERNPAVYVNTAFPKPGVAEANSGPYGICAEDDGWCRGYNYGWGTAKEVVDRARSLRISPSMYWLDVETANYWSGNRQDNSQVIRGAVDYFKAQRLPVGIYSTPYQFNLIAGTWQSPGIPNWTAGAQGVEGAARRCTPAYAFAGGTVVMVQYYDYGFDTNYICPGTEHLFPHPQPNPWNGSNGPSGRTMEHLGSALRYWFVVPQVSN